MFISYQFTVTENRKNGTDEVREEPNYRDTSAPKKLSEPNQNFLHVKRSGSDYGNTLYNDEVRWVFQR